MELRIAFYLILVTLVPRPAHLGLLENVTESLCTANNDRVALNQQNLKVLTGLGYEIRKDFKDLGDVYGAAIGDLGKSLGEEVKKLGQSLGNEIKELVKENQQLRIERITQHKEMMHHFDKISKALESSRKEENTAEFRDCGSFYKYGKRTNGVYRIKPDGLEEGFDVYCDMEADGGGWTVFQRRGNFGTPGDYFYKAWDEYKKGFGNLKGEHWLGNDRISTLSRQGAYELHIEMLDYDHNSIYARYKKFMVEGEDQLYKLHVGIFSGNDANSMARHNGCNFSTYDRDNDPNAGNCGVEAAGAWWYKDCRDSNLNSKKDRNKSYLVWKNLKKLYVDLSYVQMKTRSVSF